VHLRDRLRASDIWVDGSRAFRAFDDFLLPPKVFDDMQRERKLGLSVPQQCVEWIEERRSTLDARMKEVAEMVHCARVFSRFFAQTSDDLKRRIALRIFLVVSIHGEQELVKIVGRLHW